MKKNKRHSQKLYKMRGCSRKSCNHNHSKKQYLREEKELQHL
jgi:hypothetical protein